MSLNEARRNVNKCVSVCTRAQGEDKVGCVRSITLLVK